MRFTSLDHIVRDICIVQLGDEGLRQYMRVARAVGTALMQTNLHFLPDVRSLFIELDENYIAQLPPDALVVTKVGVLGSDMKMRALLNDSNLRSVEYRNSTEEVLYCECEEAPVQVTEPPTDPSSWSVFYNCLWGSGQYGEVYAQPSGLTGNTTWRHNTAAGVLEFSSAWVQPGYKVLVEYKSNGQGAEIPVEAVPTIRAYALYELFQLQPGRSSYYMEEFRRQARMLKALHLNIGPREIANALLNGQYSTPK